MSSAANAGAGEKTYFEQQRELVISDVAAVRDMLHSRLESFTDARQSLENVLQNLNKLNRSLEGVIAVGNEFSQVEGLWSQFENVMAKEPEKEGTKDSKEGAANDAA
ncbi:Dolichyl-diphosphooligosaccharide-protein glycosyltransferase subunit dad1 [Saxophila tyrrhenica]|uniref:DASH complex subunit DAD1 n=1 Tax=Saxophila tyrrhenica TaxID=1690608 RepID=A0AAV9P2T0_9PEZI|nr:Dolichyl-diphosphooligosaccharide-protein glycosyltransferase subunit dad1 [Saxophila tyrrhenica]